MSAQKIQNYKLIFYSVKGFSKKPAQEFCIIFTWNRVVKFLDCKIHKNEKKNDIHFFS